MIGADEAEHDFIARSALVIFHPCERPPGVDLSADVAYIDGHSVLSEGP